MMITIETSEKSNSSTVLNVHSAAIHIENKVTLVQRQAWLYLLYRAFPTLKEEATHEIPLSDLKMFLKIRKKDDAPLKSSLKALVGIALEWNIFEKDSEEWGTTGLLSYCKIVTKNGKSTLTYEFSSEIRRKLVNPTMYAKINLIISQHFKSKHALSLYCLALDYLRVKDNFGYKDFSLDDLKKYLGIADKNYSTKELKRSVLLPAKMEINKTSDIELNIIDNTRGRKIIGFRLEMRIKDKFLPAYQFPEGVPALVGTSEMSGMTVYQYPEAVQNFHEKHGVDIEAKHFKAAIERAVSALGDDLNAYLTQVVLAAQQKASFGIKNMAGFYVSQIDDEAIMLSFKQRQVQEKVQTEQDSTRLQALFELELEKVYQAQDRKAFIAFLAERLPDVGQEALALVKANANPMVKQLLSGKYAGQMSKESIASPAITMILHQHAGTFGYTSVAYPEWRDAYLSEPSHSDHLERIMQKANQQLHHA